MHPVTERLVSRSAAPAQRERATRNLIWVPVPIDKCQVVALYQVWSVLFRLDGGHLPAPAPSRKWPVPYFILGHVGVVHLLLLPRFVMRRLLLVQPNGLGVCGSPRASSRGEVTMIRNRDADDDR
jgi:hypothetical protein